MDRFDKKYYKLKKIKVKNYIKFCSNIDNLRVTRDEFNSINERHIYSTIHDAQNSEDQNRYKSVFPYAHNRVVLRPTSYFELDYINATHIMGYKQKKHYIAAQHPLSSTVYEFWHMIIQNKCRTIVMLTQSCTSNCFKFYPDSNKQLHFNDITIVTINQTNFKTFRRRILLVSKSGVLQLVMHYHLLSWPNPNTVVRPTDLSDFIQSVRYECDPKRPIVVLSTSGSGRTGIYIALDTLLDQARHKKYVNIFKTVANICKERTHMIDNIEQYQLIYAILDTLIMHTVDGKGSMYFSALLLIVGWGVGTGVEIEYHLSPPDKVFIRTSNKQYEINSIVYNGIENKVPLWSIYQMIDGLQACRKYDFEFRGVKNNNQKFHVKQKITTGIGQNHPIEIVNVTSDATTITVTFHFTRIDCIDFIEISIPEYNITYPYTIRNISESVRISGLTPCMKHNLVISATISDHNYLLYTGTVSTSLVEIKPVRGINFDKSTKLLAWHHYEPLAGAGGSCVSKYTVILKTDSVHHRNEGLRIETSQPFYDLKMLWPCSNYSVIITPNDEDDLKRNFILHTDYEEPSQVEDIMGDMIDLTLLEIKWKRPRKNYECASNYAITINGDNYQTVDNALITTNREPCDSFNVSVCSSPKNCVQKIFNFSRMMTDIQIENVSDIMAITEKNRTIITWHPPSFGSKCIKYYSVKLNGIERLVPSNTINFTNLVTCIEHNVEIGAYSVDRRKLSPKSFYKFKIKPQTKPIPPSTPELIAATSTSLTLKSEYHNSADKCELVIFRFICQSQSLEKLNVSLEFVEGKKTFEATFNDLKPSTNYTCHASVKNSELWSGGTKPYKIFSTDMRLGAKIDLTVDSTSESMRVSWKNLKQMPQPKNFLTIIKLNHNYELPANCIFHKYKEQFEIHTRSYEVRNLEPATNYSIQMVIHMADDSKEYTNIIYSSTKSGDPPNVINAQVAKKLVDPISVTIKWDLPCQLNGTINRTELQFSGYGGINRVHHDYKISIYFEKPNQNYFHTDLYIIPDYRYNVSIVTTMMNQNDILISEPVTVGFLTPPKMPSLYKLNDWASITTDTVSEIQIFLNIKPNQRAHFNSVHNTSVLITDRVVCGDLEPAYKLFDLDQNIYSSPVSANQHCIKEYHAYAISSQYIIKGCIDRKSDCEPPLKPGRAYQILMRAYTSKGFADTNPILFRTADKIDLTLVIVSIFLICLILTIGVIITLWIYKSQIKSYPIQIAPKQIDVKRFTDYYALLDPNVIIKEYDDIAKMDLSRLQKTSGLRHRRKNRYVDILPYDFNRVVLTPNKFNRDDYINASYINGFKHKNKFIAAQGPTDNTAYDFWLMVVENKCPQIVMVTQLVENEVNKCFQYYPDLNNVITFNELTIKNVNETNMEIFVRRELLVSQGQAERLVMHYQFIKWPDHGCPENEMDLIQFIEFIRNENRAPGSIVVHCSAGVGRTGTYIALDILLDEIKRNYIDICRTVRELRKQRVKSVQTVEQYKFLYACVDKYVKERICVE